MTLSLGRTATALRVVPPAAGVGTGPGPSTTLATAAALVAVGCGLAGWAAAAGARGPLGTLYFLVYPWAVFGTGRAVAPLLRLADRTGRSFAVRFLIGFTVLTAAQFLVKVAMSGSPGMHFLALLPLVGLAQFARRRERLSPPDGEACRQAWTELLLVVACLAAATCWSRASFHPMMQRGEEVVVRGWADLQFHAGLIATIGGSDGLRAAGHPDIGGLPTSPYHYASYLPAVVGREFAGSSGFAAAGGTWAPLGTLLLGLAAYSLVLSWAGRMGGLCAAAAVLAVPDASYYWPGNAFLRYHWLQQVGCAGPYGMAVASLAVAALLDWHARRNWRAFAAAGAFALASFLFKAQVFAVLALLMPGLIALWWPGASTLRRANAFAALAAVGAASFVLLLRFDLVPDCGPSVAYIEEYNYNLAQDFPEGACKRLLGRKVADVGRLDYYSSAAAVCAVASFGLWLPLGAVMLLRNAAARTLRPHDALPCLALAIYLALYVGLSDYALVGHNKWELIHRPIVWAYFVAACWCGARAYAVMGPRWTAHLESRTGLVAAAVALVPLLVLPWAMGRSVHEGKSRWRVSCANLAYPAGLVESARFLAVHAAPRDLVQDGARDERYLVRGLSERRAYLASPTTYRRDKSQVVRDEVEARLRRLEALKGCDTSERLAVAAAEMGLRWYLLHPDETVAWPSAVLGSPAFELQGYRVYDLAAR